MASSGATSSPHRRHDGNGDRVSSSTDNGFEYGETGEGFTPNVVVDYVPDEDLPQFSIYDGYGDLDNALGHGSFNVPGEIIFTPDPGFAVSLNSFDTAAWNSSNESPVQIQILDQNDNVLFDFDGPNVSIGHLTLPDSPVAGQFGEPLRLRVEDFGDQAVDNINFSQQAVPEPSSFALLGLGAFGLLGCSWRRRRKRKAKQAPSFRSIADSI